MAAFWSKIYEWLSGNARVVLLVVIDSLGSSPGRQGFKMAVNSDGKLVGSIGGGIMEHKLIELCKEDLLKRDFEPFIKRQIHQTNIPKDKSGMICSGEQTIAFYTLDASYLKLIRAILDSTGTGTIKYDTTGIQFDQAISLEEKFDLQLTTDKWLLQEGLNHSPTLHIIGGGHVGLALSHLAHELAFKVKLYDDRNHLNTIEQNKWAEHIQVSDYAKIKEYLEEGHDDFVVLMSFGYQTDKVLLKELIDQKFAYLGMMGSKEKVKKLFAELIVEGVSEELIGKVYAPIGIQIASKTPKEIAVSILAEIIQVKNA